MPHYRLYPLDGSGKFTAALDLSCLGDEDARVLAQGQLLPGEWAELWQGQRCLGQLFASATSPPIDKRQSSRRPPVAYID